MEKKKVYSVNIFASVALFFGVIGLLLSFLPLRMFALIPAGIAIYFTIIAYVLSRVFKTNKRYVYAVLGISILSIAIASITESVTTNVVVEDKVFQEKLNESSKGIDSALIEAFEDAGIMQDTSVDNRIKDSISTPVLEEEFEEQTIEDIEF